MAETEGILQTTVPISSSSWSPPDRSPWPHFKARLGGGCLTHQHPGSDLGTRRSGAVAVSQRWRSRRDRSCGAGPRQSEGSLRSCAVETSGRLCRRPRGCGGLSLPRTPSVSQPERGAPHPAWPRNSPSLPPEPLQALGLPFSGPLK